MTGVSRRRLVVGSLLLGAAMVAPTLAQTSLPFPQGDWILKRTIERQLGDGEAIVVTRRWRVAFNAVDGGASITGAQIDVDVSAPEALSALAEIESDRSDVGLFPIPLSSTGRILAASGEQRGSDISSAIDTAESIFQQAGASSAKQDQARQFLAQLQAASQPILDNLPRDLFFPSGRKIVDIKPVRLPDGTSGEFRLEYLATPQPAAPWLSTAERVITTRIGSSMRISREKWSLTRTQN